MNGETKPQDNELNQPQKEEKEFLARNEVKTMKKDMASLRETESKEEMEKMSKIKTEEEVKRETERKKRAEQESKQREESEKQAQNKEDELKKMKEEREKNVGVMEKEASEKKELKTQGLQDALRQTQTQEETERKRFLERVAAKAEGHEAPLAPKPPVVQPPVVEPQLEKTKPFQSKVLSLKRPTFAQKVWIRVTVSFLIMALLAGVGTFWYWYFVVRTQDSKQEIIEVVETDEIIDEINIPRALILVDESQVLKITERSQIAGLLNQEMTKQTEQGKITRVLFEDTNQNKILGLNEFLGSFGITPPAGLKESLDNDFTLFTYLQEEGNRFGFISKINNAETLNGILSLWEPDMEKDLKNLFLVLDYKGPAFVSYFKDGEYESNDFRFQTFSKQDIGIVYSVYDDYFVFTVSWKGMEKALDKLKEGPPPLSFSPETGAEFILKNMTLVEKIGQLFLVGVDGQTLTTETKELIENVKPGGVILFSRNIDTADQLKKLISDLQKVSLESYGMPLLIAIDQEGGDINRLPFTEITIGQSAIDNEQQAYLTGLKRGEELMALGINLNLAPVLDATNPGDFIFKRSFQKEETETSAIAKALIQGQSSAGILTAVKHFPGYGDIGFDPEEELAILNEMPETSQFQRVMSAEPEIVMTSNAVYSEIDPGTPFLFSEKGIRLLKEKLGNSYLVMTDDLSQNQLTDNFTKKEIVLRPIQAGVDILTVSLWKSAFKESVSVLVEAIGTGQIAEVKVDESVLKIIKLKQGLL